EVGVEARRDRVALRQEILAEVVGDDHFLLAAIEGVQLAVRFLLELIERGHVPLIAVASPRAEEADAEVRVAVEKSAEVAGEGLNAGADGNEVVVRSDVGELHLTEPFL